MTNKENAYFCDFIAVGPSLFQTRDYFGGLKFLQDKRLAFLYRLRIWCYIGNFTRWQEDMNVMFSWQILFLPREHIKIHIFEQT